MRMLIPLLVLFLLGCDSEDDKKICENRVATDSLIEFNHVQIPYCETINTETTLIINDSVTYQEVFGSCSNKPDLNFSDHTYVAKYTSAGGCNITPTRTVEKISDKYLYKIFIVSEGSCKQLWFSENLIELPKIDPSLIQVEVEVCKIKYETVK